MYAGQAVEKIKSRFWNDSGDEPHTGAEPASLRFIPDGYT